MKAQCVVQCYLTPGWQLIDEGGTRWVREDELDAERGVSALIPALSRKIRSVSGVIGTCSVLCCTVFCCAQCYASVISLFCFNLCNWYVPGFVSDDDEGSTCGSGTDSDHEI